MSQRRPVELRPCKQCGEPIPRNNLTPSRYSRAQFCGRDCVNSYQTGRPKPVPVFSASNYKPGTALMQFLSEALDTLAQIQITGIQFLGGAIQRQIHFWRRDGGLLGGLHAIFARSTVNSAIYQQKACRFYFTIIFNCLRSSRRLDVKIPSVNYGAFAP